MRTSPEPIDVAGFRAAQRTRPWRRYEVLASPDRPRPSTCSKAEEVMHRGWRLGNRPRIDVRPSLDWENCCGTDRSWAFHLHSWDFLAPVLACYEETNGSALLRFAVDVALDWAHQYPTRHRASAFAWYDMAIGMRAYRLGFLTDAACRTDEIADEEVDALLGSAREHLRALASEEAFASHSNHGFYQAAGQLALARRLPDLPESAATDHQAHERVRALIGGQFTEEGVHREHSPAYHHMVLQSLAGLIDTGLIDTLDAQRRRERAEEALAWFVAPDRRLVGFGDTDRRLMGRSHLVALGARSETLRFVLTHGAEGSPPRATVQAFPESGYAMLRDAWGPRARGYVALTAAFHSRTHKHADDLSFVWYDHGAEILLDAGRFGYVGRTQPASRLARDGFWYSDARRVYVESTRAHNTVEIDGRSHPRRGVRPYGSGIGAAGQEQGVSFLSGHVRHRSIRHARTVLWRPGEWLLVYDWLWDNHRAAHDFVQRFHLAPELDVRQNSRLLRATLPTGPSLVVTPLLPSAFEEVAIGVTEPELLGWVSRQEGTFQPAWTFAYASRGRPDHRFATLFTFGPEPEVDAEYCNASTSGRRARFRWHDGRRHTVRIYRPTERELSVEYDVA